MRYSIQLPLLYTIFLMTTTSIAQAAAPPFVDYQWKYSPDACLVRATAALKIAGFKQSSATDHNAEIVGAKGEYKGIIACVGEAADVAVFIVAGPNYEQARKLSVKMKENF